MQRVHAQHAHRLLRILNRVEAARAKDVTPRLPEEVEFEHKLQVVERALNQPPQPLFAQIQQLAAAVQQLEGREEAAAGAGGAASALPSDSPWLLRDDQSAEKLFHFLKTQRDALEHVVTLLRQDQRDLATIAQAVAGSRDRDRQNNAHMGASR
jgi:hypothetical protein